MSADARPLVPEELLAHANFVRALAARLLDQRDDADDVEQDAWLATLRSPPRERASARGWLRRVVSRFALERRRTTESRERREKAAAPSEALVSTHELAAKNEVLRLVADAVIALDEPHRAVILLRFYDGSPTSEVARRLGLPLETTRSRLKRALVLIREELDRRAKGGREDWMAGLAAFLPAPSTATALVASTSVGAKLLIAAVLAIVAIGGVSALWSHRSERRVGPLAVAARDPRDPDTAAAANPSPADPSAMPTRTPDPASTTPAAAAPEPVTKQARDAVGPTGTLIVDVVDDHGQVIPGRAELSAYSGGPLKFVPPQSLDAVLDRDHPHLQLDHAQVGELDVEVSLANRPDGSFETSATVRAGEETTIIFQYAGPDPTSSICVNLDETNAPFSFLDNHPAFDPPPKARLVAADGSARTGALAGGESILVFENVANGPYSFVLDDPRWVERRVDSLHAADAIKVKLEGSAAVRVFVRAVAGAPPMRDARFEINRSGAASPSTWPADDATADESSGYVISLPPSSYSLMVHAGNGLSRRVAVDDLKRGELRVVDVVLATGEGPGVIEGILVAGDGRTPLANRDVGLFAPAKDGDSPASPFSPILDNAVSFEGVSMDEIAAHLRLLKERTRTDESGRFRFAGLAPGRWILCHTGPSGIATIRDDVTIDDDRPRRDDVVLIESSGATIVGHLRSQRPVDFAGLVVHVDSPPDVALLNPLRAMTLNAPVAADGSFRVGPLQPGHVDLVLRDLSRVDFQGTRWSGRRLASVDFPTSGEKVIDFAADAFVPGEIALTIDVDGRPRSGLRAAVIRRPAAVDDFGEQLTWDDDSFSRRKSSDDGGRMRFARILPGSFTIAVASPVDGWSVEESAMVDLAAGAVVNTNVTIRTFEGRVRVLDGTGQPCRERFLFVGTPVHEQAIFAANNKLSLITREEVFVSARVRTDADGDLTLRWPVGRLAVSTRDPASMIAGNPVFVDWIEDGPKQKELRLH